MLCAARLCVHVYFYGDDFNNFFSFFLFFCVLYFREIVFHRFFQTLSRSLSPRDGALLFELKLLRRVTFASLTASLCVVVKFPLFTFT